MNNSMLHIISEKIIKPSTPTPPSLRFYNLSRIDQIMPRICDPLTFLFPTQNSDCSRRSNNEKISEMLQISLSKTLTCYYPFAGRLVNNFLVDCNDMGAHFLQVQLNCSISDIINLPNSHLEALFFPETEFSKILSNGSLLIVQLSYFICGGIALGLCLSHKVTDGLGLHDFINDWTAMIRQSNYFPSPLFNGASLFPPNIDDPSLKGFLIPPKGENFVTKNFLFHGSKIAELKAMAANSGVKNPTRVEVVTALVFKCAIAASKTSSGSFQPSLLVNGMNLRSIIVPPLPRNSVGNFFVNFSVLAAKGSIEVGLPDLFRQLRNAKIEVYKECKENGLKSPVSAAEKTVEMFQSDNVKCYICSNWCGFPLYDVDFGLGRPLWVHFGSKFRAKSTFFLKETRNGDGIVASVTLEESDMAAFEANEELLAFASLNSGLFLSWPSKI